MRNPIAQTAAVVLTTAVLVLTTAAATPVTAVDRPQVDDTAGDETPKLVILEANTTRVLDAIDTTDATVTDDMSNIGVVAITASDATAETLERHPHIRAVIDDTPTMIAATPHPLYTAIGISHSWPNAGAGTTVAILDTGVDTTHPSLTDKTVASACFSSASFDGTVTPLCAGDTLERRGAPCNIAGCDHGTAVASAAAGRVAVDASGRQVGGSAPGAALIPVQVFSKVTSGACPTGCLTAWSSDILAALEWLTQTPPHHNLAAINMSIATEPGPAICDAHLNPLSTVVEALNAQGVAVVAAAGNNGNTVAPAWPACTANVISTAGTTSPSGTWNDQVIDRFNAASDVDIAAPGTGVPAPSPTGWGYWSGTSMASPLVAGTIAAWRHARPSAPLGDALAAITNGTVRDSRTGRSYPLISHTKISPPPPTPPPPTTPLPNRPALHNFDSHTVTGRSVTISGWAFDPDGGKPAVQIFLNGRHVANSQPNRRNDAVWNFFGRTVDRNNGWIHNRAIPAGSHNVCTRVVDSNTNHRSAAICRQVVVK